ncbi:MAG: hypothetical protein HY815_15045, partial [Candidatus Riflebacteria bacterium]|nr:hypothetical protein [Candidatus Riflebacteria bacterium]
MPSSRMSTSAPSPQSRGTASQSGNPANWTRDHGVPKSGSAPTSLERMNVGPAAIQRVRPAVTRTGSRRSFAARKAPIRATNKARDPWNAPKATPGQAPWASGGSEPCSLNFWTQDALGGGFIPASAVDSIIEPTLEKLSPKVLVEVSAQASPLSLRLLELCRSSGSRLHVFSPFFRFEGESTLPPQAA